MNNARANLKRVVGAFLSEAQKAISQAERHPEKLDLNELTKLAGTICDLKRYAVELLEENPDESTWYNASIIKELLEQTVELDLANKPKMSLIQMAEELQKNNHTNHLVSVIKSLAKETQFREVLFENLELISQELAA